MKKYFYIIPLAIAFVLGALLRKEIEGKVVKIKKIAEELKKDSPA